MGEPCSTSERSAFGDNWAEALLRLSKRWPTELGPAYAVTQTASARGLRWESQADERSKVWTESGSRPKFTHGWQTPPRRLKNSKGGTGTIGRLTLVWAMPWPILKYLPQDGLSVRSSLLRAVGAFQTRLPFTVE
jgi:hypothetical protein